MVTPETIDDIVQRILRNIKPLKIILFGSTARGDADPDSDIDIVVVAEIVKDRIEETVLLKRNLVSSEYSIDLLLVSEEEFKTKIDEGWSFFRNIASEGRILYAA